MASERIPVCVDPDQLVRDLLWAVNSPSLIVGPPDFKNLSIDQVDLDHLHRKMGSLVGHRVGVYFENLIDYWLRHIRRVPILAHGLAIRDDHRTLGEIDFVFRDEDGTLTHWEVAVKFYLHEPTQTMDESHFIGPNARDTFEKKMARMFDHQLPLSQSCFPDVEVRQPLVKGQIFYLDSKATPSVFPQMMCPEHVRETFLRERDLEELSNESSVGFVRLRKPFWLSSFTAEADSFDPLTCQEMVGNLRQHFASVNRPVLIAVLNRSGDSWVETKRVFVVLDSWPN